MAPAMFYVRRAMPLARSAMRSGYPPNRAARYAAARVSTPGHLYTTVVSRVARRLRRARRPGRFLPWLFGGRPAVSPGASAATGSQPSPGYAANAIPNAQIPGGAFQFAPGSAAVPGAEAPLPMADESVVDDGTMLEDDLLEDDLELGEETPIYKRPIFLLAAAGLGFYAWKNRAKMKKKLG